MVVKHPALNVDYIEDRLRADLQSGRLWWVDASKYHRPLVGKEAGHVRRGRRNKNYWVVRISGISYLRSHLIMALATGRWPDDEVDHKNGNSLDDSITNLRHATRQQNSQNIKTRKRLSSLPMGIRLMPSGRYQARITIDKRQTYLGTFASVDDAKEMYQRARRQYFGDFA